MKLKIESERTFSEMLPHTATRALMGEGDVARTHTTVLTTCIEFRRRCSGLTALTAVVAFPEIEPCSGVSNVFLAQRPLRNRSYRVENSSVCLCVQKRSIVLPLAQHALHHARGTGKLGRFHAKVFKRVFFALAGTTSRRNTT